MIIVAAIDVETIFNILLYLASMRLVSTPVS